MATSVTEDLDAERHVEEAHCSECGKPLSAIPSWYASVHVNFSCDTCRQKASRAAPAVAAEPEVHRPAAAVAEEETDEEEKLETDADEVDLDDPDAAEVAEVPEDTEE